MCTSAQRANRLHTCMTEPVFIVNTGRCGSTMLAQMMHQNPNWLIASEYLSYLSSRALAYSNLTGEAYWHLLSTQSPVLREMHLAGQKQPEILYEQGAHGDWPLHEAPSIMLATLPFLSDTPMQLYRALEQAIRPRPHGGLADHMRAVFQTLADQTGRPVWIERTGDSLLLTHRLMQLFPKARFIHLHRDGRDVAMSMRTKPDFRAKVSYYGTLHRIGLSPYRGAMAYGVARWHDWIETLGAKVLDVRHFTDADVDLKACARHWGRMIDTGLNALSTLPPGNVLELRYDLLANDPQAALNMLADFIGAPDGPASNAPRDWIANAASKSKGAVSYWDTLDPGELARMEAVCGSQLARLGYNPGT